MRKHSFFIQEMKQLFCKIFAREREEKREIWERIESFVFHESWKALVQKNFYLAVIVYEIKYWSWINENSYKQHYTPDIIVMISQ